MADEMHGLTGVQDLIAQIRDDGLKAAEEEADKVLAAARREADQLVADARAESEELRRKTAAEIESNKQAALEALKMAARDSGLQLEAAVLAAFERHVKRLVTPITHDGSFMRALVLVLAGEAVEQHLKDKPLQILVSDLLAGKDRENEELDELVREGLLGISGDMLREGVEIIPSADVPGGASVRLVDEDLEIDLTNEAVSNLLLKHLLPRYRAIVEGVE